MDNEHSESQKKPSVIMKAVKHIVGTTAMIGGAIHGVNAVKDYNLSHKVLENINPAINKYSGSSSKAISGELAGRFNRKLATRLGVAGTIVAAGAAINLMHDR